mgnify:FL=1
MMRQYQMKIDPSDPPVELQSRNPPKDHFYEKHKRKIEELNRRVHDQQLDLRGLLNEELDLRVVQFLNITTVRLLVLSNLIFKQADNGINSLGYLPAVELRNLQQLYLGNSVSRKTTMPSSISRHFGHAVCQI